MKVVVSRNHVYEIDVAAIRQNIKEMYPDLDVVASYGLQRPGVLTFTFTGKLPAFHNGGPREEGES